MKKTFTKYPTNQITSTTDINSDDTNSGKYSFILDTENKYHYISYYEILNSVLGSATCTEPIVIDSFTRDRKDQTDYDNDYNYWRKFKGLSLDVDGDTCEVSIPAGTSFILKSAGSRSDEIDIFIPSKTGGPIVTMDYQDLAEYVITVSTNSLGDKIGDLIESRTAQGFGGEFNLTTLRNYCLLLKDIERVFGVNIFRAK